MMKIKQSIAFVLLFACFLSFSYLGVIPLGGIGPILYAQSNGDPFAEDDPFADGQDFEDFEFDEFQFEDDEGSFDGIGEGGFDDGSGFLEEDEGEYVDESIIPGDTRALLQQALLSRRNLIAEERANFIFNIAYGAGTGLMIGGWFAILDIEGDSRATLQDIGLGIVLGGLMGAIIGGRSVLAPQTVSTNFSLLDETPQIDQPQWFSFSAGRDPASQHSALKLTFQWDF